MATNQFAFIGWKPFNGRTPADNLQIRSRCMKGLNKRADSRRSKQEAKKAALEAARGASVATTEAASSSRFDEYLWLLRSRNWIPLEVRSLPPLVHVDPSIVRIAENVRKSPRGLLNEFTVYKWVTEATNVLEAFIEFNIPANRPELPPLDETMVQGILLVNSTAYDYGQRRPFGEASAPILAKTLKLLNKKLIAEEAFLEISTIFTIAYLAVVAGAVGDIEALKAHLAGLHRILDLRGGPGSLWPWAKLHTKFESLDMVLALSLGSDPYFLTDCAPDEDASLANESTSLDMFLAAGSSFFRLLDPRLKDIFRDLKGLTTTVNGHFSERTKINASVYYPALRSISSRLLQIERTLSSPPDNYICLGMLAFVLSLFQMPSKPPTYAYMIDRLRATIHSPQTPGESPPQAIVRWLLLLSTITIFDPMEPWLHETWAHAVQPGLSWEDVHQQLKAILWIDKIHDKRGRAAFEILTR